MSASSENNCQPAGISAMDERLGRPLEVKGVQSGLGRCLLDLF